MRTSHAPGRRPRVRPRGPTNVGPPEGDGRPRRPRASRRAQPCAGALALVLAATSPAAAQVDTVRLQLRFGHQFQFAGYYAARWTGAYAARGIHVEILSGLRDDGSLLEPVDALEAGRADFATLFTDGVVQRDRGADIVLVTPVFQRSAVTVFHRPDPTIRSPADLAGRTVGRGPTDAVMAEYLALLRAGGATPAVRPVGAPGERWSVEETLRRFEDGEFDVLVGYALSSRWMLRRRGVEATALDPSDWGVPFYGDALWARGDLVRERPDLVERFRDATLEGWRRAMEDPRPVADRIAAELELPVDVGDPAAYNRFLVDHVRELVLYPEVPLGTFRPERWQRMREDLWAAGLTPRPEPDPGFRFDPEGERARAAAEAEGVRARRLAVAVAALAGLALAVVVWRWMERARERARKAAILEAAPMGIFVVGRSGRVVEFNRCAGRLLDVDPGDAVGMSFDELVGCLPERLGDLVEDAAPGPSEHRILEEVPCPTPDGDERWLELSVASVPGRRGHLTVFCAMDVTERRRLVESVERVRRLESVTRLAGSVAHDFNNVMMAVSGHVDMLEAGLPRDGRDGEVAEDIEGIRDALRRADRVARELLSFAGRRPVERRSVALDRTVSEMEALLSAAAGAGIDLVTHLESTPPVRIDPAHLERALVNLVVNARDATGEAGRVVVRTRRLHRPTPSTGPVDAVPEGRYCVVEVEDFGEGIPPSVLPGIVEPFVSTKPQGSGMGLASTYGFVRQMGGFLEVRSTVGEGSLFRLLFPEDEGAPRTSAFAGSHRRDAARETAPG